MQKELFEEAEDLEGLYPIPKKRRPQSKTDMTFKEVLEALKETHTLSTKMICEYLKTYRPWVTKYILPKLDKIYLSNGYKGKSGGVYGPDWVLIAADKLKNDLKESAWYRTSDFEELLKKSLVSCTRQTIEVSSTIFVDESLRNDYVKKYLDIDRALCNLHFKTGLSPEERKIEYKKLNEKMTALHVDYIGDESMAELVEVVPLSPYQVAKRTLTPHQAYEMEWDYHKLQAVHDLKGYGGIDELIYRDLFKHGAVKLVFNYTAENGDTGEKVFYVYDKKDKAYLLDDGGPVWTVPYWFFLKYKKM